MTPEESLNRSNIFQYYRENPVTKEHWVLLAQVDESEAYQVDVAEIWRKPTGEFVLVTASGCSCWDGEYETQEFASLNELEDLVLRREGFVYNPSLLGARALVAEAWLTLNG